MSSVATLAEDRAGDIPRLAAIALIAFPVDGMDDFRCSLAPETCPGLPFVGAEFKRETVGAVRPDGFLAPFVVLDVAGFTTVFESANTDCRRLPIELLNGLSVFDEFTDDISSLR